MVVVTPYLRNKILKTKRAGFVVQVVEFLPSKGEDLSSNFNTLKIMKKVYYFVSLKE
jgi:hypothetical protein